MITIASSLGFVLALEPVSAVEFEAIEALPSDSVEVSGQGSGNENGQGPQYVQEQEPSALEDDPLLDGLLGEPDPAAELDLEPSAEDSIGEEAEEESKTPQRLKGFRGQVRLVSAFFSFARQDDDLPLQDDAIVSGIARAIYAREFAQYFSVEGNVYLDLSRAPGNALAGAFASASTAITTYRSPDLKWTFWEEDVVQGELGLDRLFLSWQKGRFSGAVGRFPINDSVSRIFTPNDFFAPFSATAINRAYKPGVDALRIAYSFAGLSSVEGAAVLGFRGHKPTWGRSAITARLATVKWGIEWAGLGGKLAERWFAGLSLQGDVGPLSLHSEGHVGVPDPEGDGHHGKSRDGKVYGRFAGGLSKSFDWQRLNLGVEYGYRSDGALSPSNYIERSTAFYPDDLPYLAGHYLGASASIEIAPRLSSTAIGLANAVDGSGIAGLFLRYDAAEQADLNLGCFIPWGASSLSGDLLQGENLYPQSEFGLAPISVFVDTQVYF